MAISAHQKVSPIETVTAPRTTLKTLTLPPNQNANWCQGLPYRAPAGMWSMCRFSTYRRSCSFRAADTAICAHPFLGEMPASGVGGMLVVLADWGYQLPIRLAAFSAMASTVACTPRQ
jgi:hypothetical protein